MESNLFQKWRNLRRGYRVMLAAFSLLLILSVIGLTFESIASRRDEKSFPPPGIMVETSLGNMHLTCQGEGDITVVAESGLGDFSLEWAEIQPEIIEVARMCAYDRPGLGWSDPVEDVLTPQEIADNLHELLEKGGEKGPFILVGHSIGGIYVREYVHRYPEEVVGLVLVDSSHENQRNRLPEYSIASFESYENTTEMIASIGSVLHPFGLPRAFKLFEGMLNDNYSDETREAILARMYQPHFYRSYDDEMKTQRIATSQNDPPQDLGDLPLVVLTQGYAENDTGLSEAEFNELRDINMEMQEELASLSSNNEYIIAEESGHYIHSDQPELVIDAIKKLIDFNSQDQ
jgi:pimeloyl-ACP methyl ester carboxylesterase